MFEQGTVYFLAGLHYYFVLSDSSADPDNVVVVNMTTFRGFASEDRSCILEENEHPAIRHKSWVKYEKAEVVPLRMLNHRLKTNVITEVYPDKCPPNVLQRIIAGAESSALTPNKILTILKSQNIL